MNASRPLIVLAAVLSFTAGLPTRSADAADTSVAGPNGGRIVKGPAGTRVEFHVGADRVARIRALGPDLKPVAADTVSASLRIRKPAATVAFTRAAGGAAGPSLLVAGAPLPAGDPYPVILTLKSRGKTANVRFTLALDKCGECGFAEYACICGH